MTLPGRLLLITDRTLVNRPLHEVVSAAIAAGCRWVWVREKDLSTDQLTAVVGEMVKIARPFGATISVSSNPSIASQCGARGIHLPREGSVAAARNIVGPNALIGISAHSQAEAHWAAESGADYITLSPIFLSTSKPAYSPTLGLNELQRLAAALPIPVIALGGITAKNAADCLHAGAAGVAVMGTIMRATNPGQVTKEILTRLDSDGT